MPPQQCERLLDFVGEGLRLGAHGRELFSVSTCLGPDSAPSLARKIGGMGGGVKGKGGRGRLRSQPVRHIPGNLLSTPLPDRAFPDHLHAPPCSSERNNVPFVPGDILLELARPEVRSRRGRGREAASPVPVPEAAMHEDHRSVGGKNKIGSARKPLAVKPVPEAHSMQVPPQFQFRFRVLTPNPRHHARPGCSIDHVGHCYSFCSPASILVCSRRNRMRVSN